MTAYRLSTYSTVPAGPRGEHRRPGRPRARAAHRLAGHHRPRRRHERRTGRRRGRQRRRGARRPRPQRARSRRGPPPAAGRPARRLPAGRRRGAGARVGAGAPGRHTGRARRLRRRRRQPRGRRARRRGRDGRRRARAAPRGGRAAGRGARADQRRARGAGRGARAGRRVRRAHPVWCASLRPDLKCPDSTGCARVLMCPCGWVSAVAGWTCWLQLWQTALVHTPQAPAGGCPSSVCQLWWQHVLWGSDGGPARVPESQGRQLYGGVNNMLFAAFGAVFGVCMTSSTGGYYQPAMWPRV